MLGFPEFVTDISRYWALVRHIVGDMWRRYCCLISFFPIIDTCLSCEDIAGQSCAIVCRSIFAHFGDFLRHVFPASRVQHISDMQFKFALRPHHVSNMVDIQSATAEIRRGNKKLECGPMPNVMSARPNVGGAHCESSVIPFLVPCRFLYIFREPRAARFRSAS